MFAERLKQFRKGKRISQAALAEQLGISQQAVGKWERGYSTPDPSTLDKIANILEVSVDALLGRRSNSGETMLPIIGMVKAGYNAYAFQEDYGSELANVSDPERYFYLIVNGDSMEPQIRCGDLALVRRQADVESGELAVVLVDGEEGTLKRVIKKNGAVILQPFNQAYEAQIYLGEEITRLTIIGKVVETKTKW